MNEFYFTFGSDEGFPYQGGWVKVIAGNAHEAVEKFKAKYPNRWEKCLNCADFYSSASMRATGMLGSGNRGAFCHEVIE